MRAERGERATKKRQGSGFRPWLAIFSLLLQLVATAGHFHPEDFVGAGKIVAATTFDGGTNPADTQPALPHHDDCPFCASLSMVGAAASPAPIVLALPDPEGLALPVPSELWLVGAPYLLFQTRAPPVI